MLGSRLEFLRRSDEREDRVHERQGRVSQCLRLDETCKLWVPTTYFGGLVLGFVDAERSTLRLSGT